MVGLSHKWVVLMSALAAALQLVSLATQNQGEHALLAAVHLNAVQSATRNFL